MPADQDTSVDPSRRALLVGGLVAAGGAAIVAGTARSQTAPDPIAGHDMSAMSADPYAAPMPGMAHGNMTTLGSVDHARNGFDPTAMLTDWDTGTTELLPDGRTLRTFEVEAYDKEIEIAPGIFFPAWNLQQPRPRPCPSGEGRREAAHHLPQLRLAPAFDALPRHSLCADGRCSRCRTDRPRRRVRL